MHPRLLLSYVFYSSIAIFPYTSAQTTLKPVLNENTDAFINQVLKDWNSPGGAAVAVVRKDDQGAWNIETKGYGIATANGSEVTENTLFSIGSNSKVTSFSFLLHTTDKLKCFIIVVYGPCYRTLDT